MRRFTRADKCILQEKFQNHVHSVNLHMLHYNFARIHQTPALTPAMRSVIANHSLDVRRLFWTAGRDAWDGGKKACPKYRPKGFVTPEQELLAMSLGSPFRLELTVPFRDSYRK